MEILASCTLDESLKHGGKLLIERDGSKPDKVSLNVVVDDGDVSVLDKVGKNVKCVTFFNEIPNIEGTDLEGKPDVFVEVGIDGISDSSDIPTFEGVTTLLRVESTKPNLRELKGYCDSVEGLRVIGGNLLQIDGLRIGRYEQGKDKGSPVYKDVYDTFLEVPLSEIDNLQEVVKKARKRLEGNEEGKKRKNGKSGDASSKPTVKKVVNKAFTSLFGDFEEEDF